MRPLITEEGFRLAEFAVKLPKVNDSKRSWHWKVDSYPADYREKSGKSISAFKRIFALSTHYSPAFPVLGSNLRSGGMSQLGVDTL